MERGSFRESEPLFRRKGIRSGDRIQQRQVQYWPNFEDLWSESIEALSPLERGVELRRRLYLIIYQALPQLAGVMPADPRGPAGSFRGLGKFLSENPHLLEHLTSYEDPKPAGVTMLIYPQYPLVLARYVEAPEPVALVPAISCTNRAIKDLAIQSGHYRIVASDNRLAGRVWELAERSAYPVLAYNPNDRMSPEDYVALAAQGMLQNEVYRTPVSRLFKI